MSTTRGRDLDDVIAGALGVDVSSLTPDTGFHSIPQWDSLGHVELMLALEEHWGVEIGADLVTRLRSVRQIREFDRGPRPVTAAPAGAPDTVVHRGLSGVYLDETEISSIDPDVGRLAYRGYAIDELVEHSTFEETAFLLLAGHLPSADELSAFDRSLRDAERVPPGVATIVRELRGLRPIDALRTALSAVAGLDDGTEALAHESPVTAGARVLGGVSALVAEHNAQRSGRRRTSTRASFAGRLLGALSERANTAAEVRLFDRCLILLAEHGSNASAFAARVAIGTGTDLHSALTSAIAVFAGPLHGGAIEGVAQMIDSIGEPSNAGRWVNEQRARRQPVFGFGHRLYRTEDPRAPYLRAMAESLSRAAGDMRPFRVLEALRREMSDRARLGIDVNVDLYAGLVFTLLGVRTEHHLPVFAAARTSGWTAHASEQRRNNVLIRPLLRYVGPSHSRFPAPADRAAIPASADRDAAFAGVPAGRLHSGFLASARSTPDAPALRHADRTWSYSELEDTARRWAAAIVGELGRPAMRVAVFGVRSEVSYAGTLASLFSGGAFVPLSPEMPADRTRRMLEAAGVDALIVDAEARPMLADVLGAGVHALPVLDPDGDGRAISHGVRTIDARALRSIAPLEAIPDVASDATAYLLFTSGSTGQPKGVPISHANVAHFLDVNLARYSLSPEDRLSQTFQQTFDLSVFDLFMAWGSGACLAVPEPIDLVSPFDYVARNDVTVWFSVPSLATLLLRKGLLGRGSLPSLRWSLFCGEALPVATARAWQAAAPDSILENLYGPTECTIACTAYRWSGARSEAESVNGLVPIGVPWDGVSALVDDGSLADAAPGATGELAIGGRQTFAGYWHAPEITQRALFTRSGGLDESPQTFYRTGDRVSVLPSGALAFLGRLDHQVKVLGHRVELGDVEAALRAQPGVTEAVAVTTGTSGGSSDGLAAFVLGADVDPVALAESVRARLPVYMVPRTIRIVDEFPRNASGKVDRRSLAATLEA